jgi:hypothetical protein
LSRALAAGPQARIMAGKAPRILDQLNREDDMRNTGHGRLIDGRSIDRRGSR